MFGQEFPLHDSGPAGRTRNAPTMMCSALGDVPCCSEHGFSALQLAFHLDIDLDA